MTAIESESELDLYESIFGEFWESAVMRLSIIDVNEDLQVPNGEIVFQQEEADKLEQVLYSEGPFRIIEKTVENPFSLLRSLSNGELAESAGVDIELLQYSPEQRFLNQRESRVLEPRPRTELHSVFTVEMPDDVEDAYKETVDELNEQLKRASEPYYRLDRCEDYYFDLHFRGKDTESPEILSFAETGIEFEIDSQHRLTTVIPELIVNDTAVSVLPQKPYGARKGWRLNFEDLEPEQRRDGLVEFCKQLDLDGVDRSYIILFVDGEVLEFIEHPERGAILSDDYPVNTRYRLLDEYDQRGKMVRYLQGEEPNAFEVAVLNTLSTAGYLVQWFGDKPFDIPNWDRESKSLPYDEVDIVAHRADGSQVLFVECTNKRISEKESLLDRTEEIAAVLREEDPDLVDLELIEQERRKIVPVIATPQMPEELNDQVVAEYNEKGVVVLDGEKLTEIYRVSSDQTDPIRVDIDPEMWDLEVF